MVCYHYPFETMDIRETRLPRNYTNLKPIPLPRLYESSSNNYIFDATLVLFSKIIFIFY